MDEPQHSDDDTLNSQDASSGDEDFDWLNRGQVRNPVAASPGGNGGKRPQRNPQQNTKKGDEKTEEKEEAEKDKDKGETKSKDKKDGPSSPKKKAGGK